MSSRFLLAAAIVLFGPAAAPNTPAGLGAVDFRYSPPWWQSTISLPDDPDKILVGKEGQILLDFHRGQGGPRGFGLWVQPDIAEGARWKRQETLSGRVPIVRTWLDADGVEVMEEAFVATPEGSTAGQSRERRAVVIVTLKNATHAAAVRRPKLLVRGVVPLHLMDGGRVLQAGEETRITAGDRMEPPVSELVREPVSEKDTDYVALLPPVTLQPGESREVAFAVDRHAAQGLPAISAKEARRLREAARSWWEEADLPFAVVEVPDAGIQGMLESSVRNIWQARDIVDGKVAFHVGPTVYHSLFVVDGAFLLEAAAILGRARDARDGIEYLLGHQEADGSFAVIERYGGVKGYWKENGIVLWAAVRHAQLTGDKDWLRAKWPALKRVVQVIQRLRAETRKDPHALEYGLMPGGFVDGGISNRPDRPPGARPEYSNVYWNLAGLKAAIAGAEWLGDTASATEWQKEYDEFYAAFRKAAARDTLQDQAGNAYVPVMMANADGQAPARGQWAFCHAVYPGTVFPVGDPLVEGQLAMLRATKTEGLIFDTGWMKQGIWTYFASFYGHAVLWDGHGREAAEVLYDFARHASPTRVWREEQKPVGKGAEEVGDMPHNWASAEFIRLATHLIELDRGDELHLLEGFPREWAGPGMVTRLNGVLTPFGPLHLELDVASDGRSARLKMAQLTRPKPARIVLHLDGLGGENKTMELPQGENIDRRIKLNSVDYR